jgi:hypothetical protein
LVSDFKKEHPNIDSSIEVLDYDPNAGDLTQTARRALTSMSLRPNQRVALIAPFFLLQQIGISEQSNESFNVQRYASNYAAQGVKLKRCKSLLIRTYCRLSHLGPGPVEKTPFLTTKDGIIMVDLSPIPEKYRLLVPRAEEILNRCLGAWLRVVEQALENRESAEEGQAIVHP